jgi:hypothetical protein
MFKWTLLLKFVLSIVKLHWMFKFIVNVANVVLSRDRIWIQEPSGTISFAEVYIFSTGCPNNGRRYWQELALVGSGWVWWYYCRVWTPDFGHSQRSWFWSFTNFVCTIYMCWWFLLCVSQFSLVQRYCCCQHLCLPLSSNWVRMWDREKWLTQHFICRPAL